MQKAVMLGALFLALLRIPVWCGESACDSLADPYVRARCLDARGEPSEAMLVMSDAVNQNPSFRKSHFFLQLLLKNKDKAGLKLFTPGFAARYLDSGEVTLECARAYCGYGEWKQAAALLERRYAKTGRFDYLQELAGVYSDNKAALQAESILEKMLSIDSGYAEAWYLKGKLVFRHGLLQKLKERKTRAQELREALLLFQRAATLDSLTARYFMEIGAIYTELGVWDSTLLAYDKAVLLAPKDFQFLMRYGKLLADKMEYGAACRLFEKAFEADSTNVNLLLDLEAVHKKLGDFADYYLLSQERLADALPDTLSIRYNLGLEYLRRDSSARARSCFEKVLRRNPDFEEANQALANLFLTQGRYSDALPYLERLARRPGGGEKRAFAVAQTLLLAGDTAASLAAYEKTLDKYPKNAEAAYFVGTYYYNIKEYAQCAGRLPEDLNYRDKPGALRMLGGSLFHLEQEPAKALRCLLACEGTAEDDEVLHYMLAALLERLKRPREALEQYQRCLEKAPDSANADFYRSRIKALGKGL